MFIDNLVEQVKEINVKTDYWFVRTDNGKYFETFYKNGFIAVGWNNVTIEELKNGNKDETVRKKIFKAEKLEVENPASKSKVTGIINKLNNFVNLKKGDIIIIPSENSYSFAFGIVESSSVYIDNEKSFECDFYKRKKVKWLERKPLSELDPNFFRMKTSRHTISKIDDYSEFIDSVINSLYMKNDNTHFVLDIKTTDDINVVSLLSLIQNIQQLVNNINDDFELDEKINHNSIRLNLQSPGKIEFKLLVGKSLITLATILSLTCCKDGKQKSNIPKLDKFIETHNDTINKIKKSMNELEVDKDRINSFNYGN